MNSIKQLALRLAAVNADARQELLAMLPKEKKVLLLNMLLQVQPVVADQGADFESILNQTENDEAAPPIFDREALLKALAGENHAIKQQMLHIFIDRQETLLTNHVRTLLADYLSASAGSKPVQSHSKRKWWYAKHV